MAPMAANLKASSLESTPCAAPRERHNSVSNIHIGEANFPRGLGVGDEAPRERDNPLVTFIQEG